MSLVSLCLLPWFTLAQPMFRPRSLVSSVNSASAQEFVRRLVMQTVFEVLESQGRSAFLPDAVISAILGQLEVRVTYDPLLCAKVVFGLMNYAVDQMDDK
ncbi:hypothetical protein KIN20_030282 [Parelaphostrongylus tenuis]|uniref:Uncharacterized protein n=1 Tax=Parelaphostrongylus tenuis TaxID=148309 RepID=A0AAD5R3K8_PARTN|nr:hypothetical protein KIN20_030282 [Parelaphostrongylus tenuis]